ncbi:MAG TPA: ABC transporter ATP-binding protein, partial [Ktedonobacter sp.]|nr:ABC transporter ATP-binding protein [Ktedonobacter sp.]
LKREFTVADEYSYNRSGPARWITSHLLRYKLFVLLFMFTAIMANVLNASIPALTGVAFNVVLSNNERQLVLIALALLAILLCTGVSDIT